MPLRTFPNFHLRGGEYDRAPRYYVYGGLLFVPLSVETLKTFGRNWTREAPRELVGEFAFRTSAEPELAQQERVVLLRRLDHPVNSQIAWSRNQVVERVNGHDISSLEVLIDAIENHEGEHHVLEFAHAGRVGVLDRREVEAANAEILARYGIERDRSL